MADHDALAARLAAARGEVPAELVLTGGRVVNVFNATVEEVDVALAGGRVVGLGRYQGLKRLDLGGRYLLPGLIEGHLHVESTLLTPAELARTVAPRGTSLIVADPHEIANVMGLAGVRAMLATSQGLPVEFLYMAPSCVPATHLETAGAALGPRDLARLAREEGILGLAEVMNFPGAVAGDPEVLAKIAAFAGRPVDGHAPLLAGKDLNAYLAAGPESDHECTRYDEAAEKLARGMWVMIRQGTSAHNLAELLPLVTPLTERRIMLVSDDRHPDDLAGRGHLDDLLRSAVAQGLDPLLAVRLVTLNPARRFGLARRGAVAPGYLADLVVVEDLESFGVDQVFHAGELVAEGGRCLAECERGFDPAARATMRLPRLGEGALDLPVAGHRARAIRLVPGQILTEGEVVETPAKDGLLAADPARDLARLVVVERHTGSGRVGQGLLQGLGLKEGALASSVAHDSHNLVAAGMDPASLLTACRRVGELGGGLVVARGGEVLAELALPLAGLMSDQRLDRVLAGMEDLRRAAGRLTDLPEPWMALSFVALPVIPRLKLTDRGLVDVAAFELVDLFLD